MKARLAPSAFTTSNLRQVTSGRCTGRLRTGSHICRSTRSAEDAICGRRPSRPDGVSSSKTEPEDIAAARVVEDGAAAYRLGEFGEGAFVTGTEQVVRFAEREEVVQNGHFEPQVAAEISAEIFVIALWLQNLGGGVDYILTVPTAAAASGDKPAAVRTGDAFIAEMRSLAESISGSRRNSQFVKTGQVLRAASAAGLPAAAPDDVARRRLAVPPLPHAATVRFVNHPPSTPTPRLSLRPIRCYASAQRKNRGGVDA